MVYVYLLFLMKLSLNLWNFFHNADIISPVGSSSLEAFHAFSLLAPHWLVSCPFPPNFETARSHDHKMLALWDSDPLLVSGRWKSLVLIIELSTGLPQ